LWSLWTRAGRAPRRSVIISESTGDMIGIDWVDRQDAGLLLWLSCRDDCGGGLRHCTLTPSKSLSCTEICGAEVRFAPNIGVQASGAVSPDVRLAGWTQARQIGDALLRGLPLASPSGVPSQVQVGHPRPLCNRLVKE
jgi:hypothetical protein